jgi:tellurite resistance protein TerC
MFNVLNISNDVLLWIVFNVFVFAVLAIDLWVFNRKAHEVKIKEALGWSAVWISLALVFNAGIWIFMGSEKALSFLSGYLIEKSLSVDNLFVFLVVFSCFGIKPAHQHKILFWGILGALLLRGIFIMAGITLIHAFGWLMYVFGAVLIFTAFKLAFKKEGDEPHPEKSPVVKIFRRIFPVTDGCEDGRFFVRKNGTIFATMMFVTLLVVETTDILFAVDSIPAVMAITTDPFIVYTSNVFAILGLRALYFALAGIMGAFRYLNYGLSVIIGFVGIKMLAADFYHIPSLAALGVIASVLTASILASVFIPVKGRTLSIPIDCEAEKAALPSEEDAK